MRRDESARRLIGAGCIVAFLIFKFLHVIGAVVLLGTGAGIAFFMLMAHRTGDAAFIAGTASTVVVADAVFTLTAIIVQPVTGYLLMHEAEFSFSETWIWGSLLLYFVAGAFWVPVVWMQVRMRDLAAAAAKSDGKLPDAYRRLFRIWFLFGFPGFGAVLAIVWLMIAKPT